MRNSTTWGQSFSKCLSHGLLVYECVQRGTGPETGIRVLVFLKLGDGMQVFITVSFATFL